MPPECSEQTIAQLLAENLALAKENNRLLREIRRNALISVCVQALIWLLALGIPLFIIGSYLGPILEAFSGSSAGITPGVGLPSEDQLRALLNAYGELSQ